MKEMSHQLNSLLRSQSSSALNGETGLEMWARLRRERTSLEATNDYRSNHASWLNDLYPELFSERLYRYSDTSATHSTPIVSQLASCKCRLKTQTNSTSCTPSNYVVEVRGEPASGKTHWLCLAALRTLLPESSVSRFESFNQFLEALREAQSDSPFGAYVLLVDCDIRFSALRFFELLKSHCDAVVRKLVDKIRKRNENCRPILHRETDDDEIDDAAVVSECVDSCLRRIQFATATNYGDLHLVLHSAFDRFRTQSATVTSTQSELQSTSNASANGVSQRSKTSQMRSGKVGATQGWSVSLPHVLVAIDNVSALCIPDGIRNEKAAASTNASYEANIGQRCVAAVRKLIQIYDALVLFTSRTCSSSSSAGLDTDADDCDSSSSSERVAFTAFSRFATHLVRIESTNFDESEHDAANNVTGLNWWHAAKPKSRKRTMAQVMKHCTVNDSSLVSAPEHFRTANLIRTACACKNETVMLSKCEFTISEAGLICRSFACS